VAVRLVAMDDHGSLQYSRDDPFHHLPDYRHHFDGFLDRVGLEYFAWNLPPINYSRRIAPFQHVQFQSIQVLHSGSRLPSWADDNVDQCDQVDH
jgi:hypothetical protein